MKTTRWTSFAIFLLGLWQLSAPVTFGYSSHYLMASDLLTGALLIGFGIYLRREPKVWAYWMVALIGVWLQIAPLVFWAPQAACYVSNTMVGILAILFSISFRRSALRSPKTCARFPRAGAIIPPRGRSGCRLYF